MRDEARTKKSTNVRSNTYRLLSGAFRTWGRVAPESASRAMVSLMGRTVRGKPSTRAREALATGQRFAVDGPAGQLTGWTFGTGPTVYLAHGWNGRATQMTAFVPGIVSAGFRAVLYDQPGHGESAGSYAHVGLFAAAVGPVRDLFGPAHAVIAHSLGAAGVAVAQKRGDLDARRMVFVAPSSRPIEYVRAFARDFAAGPAHEDRFFRELTGRVGLDEHDLDVPAFALPAATLVIHDRRDDDVAIDAGAAIADQWPDATLYATEGLGHTQILRDPEAVGAAVDFVVHGSRPARPWGGPLASAPLA